MQPVLKEDPVGNFTELSWSGQWEAWPLVKVETPGDGSCLFHAICNAFFTPYHEMKLGSSKMSRSQIVRSFRKELAEKLAEKIPDKDITFYEALNDGNTKKFSGEVPEFKLERMQVELAGRGPIGYGYLGFVSDVIKRDIYILDGDRKDIYVTDEVSARGNRNSIVLLYQNGHYELVGIKTETGIGTYFAPTHSFIRFLYNKI